MTFHHRPSRPTEGFRKAGKRRSSNNSPRVCVGFDEDDFQWLTQRAKQQRQPFGAVVRQAVEVLRLSLADE